MLALALALAATDVLDVGPTRPYAEIQSAIHAAQSGDIIRVDEGTYGHFVISNKSLRILPREEGARVSIAGAVRIQETQADQTVVLDGLRITGTTSSTQAALVIGLTLGPVRVQDCVVTGSADGFQPATGNRVGVLAVQADDLTIVDSSITGGEDYRSNGATIGQEGMVILDSRVTLWSSTVTGTDCDIQAFSMNGGDGIRAFDSDLLVDGCTLQSGDGGDSASFPGCSSNGCGGACLRADGCTVRFRDVTFVQGMAGWDLCGSACGTFVPGPRFAPTGGTTSTTIAGPTVTLDAGHGWLSSGDPLTVAVDGEPGFAALLVVGPATARFSAPAFNGDLHVTGPLGSSRRLFLGSAPATFSTTLPTLGPFDATEWFLQPALVGNGRVEMGPVRSLTLLGAGW